MIYTHPAAVVDELWDVCLWGKRNKTKAVRKAWFELKLFVIKLLKCNLLIYDFLSPSKNYVLFGD